MEYFEGSYSHLKESLTFPHVNLHRNYLPAKKLCLTVLKFYDRRIVPQVHVRCNVSKPSIWHLIFIVFWNIAANTWFRNVAFGMMFQRYMPVASMKHLVSIACIAWFWIIVSDALFFFNIVSNGWFWNLSDFISYHHASDGKYLAGINVMCHSCCYFQCVALSQLCVKHRSGSFTAPNQCLSNMNHWFSLPQWLKSDKPH